MIYIVTNKINQKIYIGRTSMTLHKRRSRHEYAALQGDSSYRFHQALRKHGIKSFTWRVLEDTSPEEAELEAYYIDLFGSYFPNIGYNMSADIQGIQNVSEATRQKLSESMKTRKVSAETRKRMSESHKGIPGTTLGKTMGPRPEDVKKKISESLKGRARSAIVREKISKSSKGRVVSPETGRKISEAKKGKPSPRKGISMSEEQKLKIKETLARKKEQKNDGE